MYVYREPKGHREGLAHRFIDSFKRDPNARVVVRGTVRADGKVFDLEDAFEATASSPLARSLRGRHLQMIAIGGCIGTGLFIASGRALAVAGPGSLVIAFGLIGIMLFCTVHALGEMAVLFPVAGSFSAYSTRFLDPAWGFAMGWNYALQWLALLPLELVAASITANYWLDGRVSSALWISLYLFIIFAINMLGVKAYGEAEFVFSSIKIVAIIAFIITGIIINVGGGPQGGYIGGAYWNDPTAFKNGFKGLCSVFVTAALAFVGTEMVGLCAAETKYPRQSIPTAVRQTFWRITLFYIVSLTIVGLLVKSDDPALLKGGGTDPAASPFVIAIKNAGIKGLDSVFNAVIMFVVLGVGNSAVYGSSRTMAALAEQHQGPRALAYIDRMGRPIVAILVSLVVGLLGYVATTSADALSWFAALSGLSGIFTWGSICLAHIRFRKAWREQGHSLDELAFRSSSGVIGSWLGFGFNMLILLAQLWVAIAPLGYQQMSTSKRLTNFFQAYLAFPIILLFYIPYKFYYKTPFIRCADMNLYTGILEINLTQILAEERAQRARWPKWKQWYHHVC
ncbi:MAG: glyceraldehyde-3-phosphate dehydrogenase 1 [Caeruleum heppii]|nr:MAG: glyceraldehyde-3-phosphate dehydrogenase 1 [Caeruleum heppii]